MLLMVLISTEISDENFAEYEEIGSGFNFSLAL